MIRKIMICLVSIAMLAGAAYAEIQLEWDAVEGVDGYKIFQAIRMWNPETQQNEHHFDYSSPVTTENFPDGKIPQNVTSIVVDITGVENTSVKYLFVARSFIGDEESEDSNMVSYKYDLTKPPAPVNLAGGYDKDAQAISLSWSQPEEEWGEVDHWKVYYRMQDGEFIELAKVDDEQNLTLTTDFDKVGSGEVAEVDFVVVAFRNTGQYSADSDVLTITIDRRDGIIVPPVPNLRINIFIPVTDAEEDQNFPE